MTEYKIISPAELMKRLEEKEKAIAPFVKEHVEQINSGLEAFLPKPGERYTHHMDLKEKEEVVERLIEVLKTAGYVVERLISGQPHPVNNLAIYYKNDVQ